MHMRRIAPLLADLFVRHGLAVEAEATVAGRRGTGAEYTVPLAIRDRSDAILLVDGDFSGAPVDNVTLATFKEACHDTGASGLFVHSGPLSTAAARVVGDRIRLWSADALAQFIGQTELCAALGQPLPAVPEFRAWDVVAAPALEAAPPQTLAEAAAIPGSAVPAEPDGLPDLTDELEIDLPQSAAADIEELAEAPAPMAPDRFIELGDETPVLHLEDADGTDVEVEPAPATATQAPDVIELTAIEPPAVEPARDVLAEAEFEEPAASELLPPAFREPAAIQPAQASEPLFALPTAFAAEEGQRITAPEGSQGLLPPQVTLAEAKHAVGDRLFGIEEAELILQPVHLFDYRVDVLRPGTLTAAPITGRVQVNGTDRRVLAADAVRCDPRRPHRVFATPELTLMDKVLRVGPERAEQLATTWVTAEHAKVVQVTTDRADDSYAVTERKSITPTSGQVALTPLGLWHRPFWRLWGDNGHIDLDAVDGSILDEELKTPNPDFLVVE